MAKIKNFVIPKKINEEIQNEVKNGSFESQAEFIRNALREFIQKQKRTR